METSDKVRIMSHFSPCCHYMVHCTGGLVCCIGSLWLGSGWCPALKPAYSSAIIVFGILGWLFDSSCTVEDFLGRVTKTDWVYGMGHPPVCQMLLQILSKALITPSPPTWTSYPGILSIPGNFLFFREFTAASTSSREEPTLITTLILSSQYPVYLFRIS